MTFLTAAWGADEAIGQKALGLLVVRLLDRLAANQPRLLQPAVDQLGVLLVGQRHRWSPDEREARGHAKGIWRFSPTASR